MKIYTILFLITYVNSYTLIKRDMYNLNNLNHSDQYLADILITFALVFFFSLIIIISIYLYMTRCNRNNIVRQVDVLRVNNNRPNAFLRNINIFDGQFDNNLNNIDNIDNLSNIIQKIDDSDNDSINATTSIAEDISNSSTDSLVCVICTGNKNLYKFINSSDGGCNCSIYFHEECIKKWFKISPVCPICRKQYN